jgi:hypothetical protein
MLLCTLKVLKWLCIMMAALLVGQVFVENNGKTIETSAGNQ